MSALWVETAQGERWLEDVWSRFNDGEAPLWWCLRVLRRLDRAACISILFTPRPIPVTLRRAATIIADGECEESTPPHDWPWAYARAKFIATWNEGGPRHRVTDAREDWWAEEIRKGVYQDRPSGLFYSRYARRTKGDAEYHLTSTIDAALEQADNVFERVNEAQQEAMRFSGSWR